MFLDPRAPLLLIYTMGITPWVKLHLWDLNTADNFGNKTPSVLNVALG